MVPSATTDMHIADSKYLRGLPIKRRVKVSRMHKNVMLLKEIVWRSPDDYLPFFYEEFLRVTHSISKQKVLPHANHSEKHWIKGSNKALE